MKIKTLANGLVLLTLSVFVCAQEVSQIGDLDVLINSVLCDIFSLFWAIAGALAALVLIIAGIKWVMSQDDPGARKQATDTMKHVVIGLIIILAISSLVQRISTKFVSCSPEGRVISATGLGTTTTTTTTITTTTTTTTTTTATVV